MAKRTILIDDLDDTLTADATVTFGLDGTTYEIDLTEAHAGDLREALAPFMNAGRRVGNRTNSPRRTQAGPSNREIRDWARTNGIEVPERGRVPADVVAAFNNR